MIATSLMQRQELQQLRQHGYDLPDPDSALDLFERKVADFFHAPEAVVTDSCTHALEIALRFLPRCATPVQIPCRTYMSVPMTLDKLGIDYELVDRAWQGYYQLEPLPLIDAATWWQPGSYQAGKIMALSFQFKKHIAIGRGGMLLLDDVLLAKAMRQATHDGRQRHVDHAKDDVHSLGFHYHMTPEDAARGVMLFDLLAHEPARVWHCDLYQDLRDQSYFRHHKSRP